MNFKWLKELCDLPGISGRETAVREWLIAHLPADAPYEIDPLGNLIVNKAHGAVMLCAHMDEVGMIVTNIMEDGFLQFAHVGGVERAAYLGRQVLVGARQIPGVVGITPVHLIDDKRAIPGDLYIDIGADTRKAAQQAVKLGDSVTFAPNFTRFGAGFIASKAIDDRVGCLILLELLRDCQNMCAVFTTREEVGGAAGAAAFALAPRRAIVLETTTAADLPGISGAQRVCALGAGAVVPFMDRGTVYPSDLYERAMALAAEQGIPVQTKTVIAGGNDAGVIHKSGGGVPTVTISAPCRNLHSPTVVMQESDAAAVYSLAKLLWEDFTQ